MVLMQPTGGNPPQPSEGLKMMAHMAKFTGAQNPAQLHPNWPVSADQSATQSHDEATGQELVSLLHRMVQASGSQVSAAPAQTEAAGPPGPQTMLGIDPQKLYELVAASDPATMSLLLAAQLRDAQAAGGPVTDRQPDPAAALALSRSPAVANARPADMPVASRAVGRVESVAGGGTRLPTDSKQKNRDAQRRFRERQKKQIQELHERATKAESLVASLAAEVDRLRKENELLMSQLNPSEPKKEAG